MNKFDNIDYKVIDDFISNLPFTKSESMLEIYNYAMENNVPIIKDDVASFLQNMLLSKKPKRILELGTAIGYSSIFMAEVLSGNCEIDTIEKNYNMYEIAKKNIDNSNYKINPIFGDAIDELTKLDKNYDFVFIDAAKGHYREFFDLIYPILSDDGIIISDNMLHKGLVCLSLEDVPRRQRTIARNMKSFIEYIYDNPQLKTSLIPIGDGVMINNVIK